MANPNGSSSCWQRATGLQQAMVLASLNPESPGTYWQQLLLMLPEKTNESIFFRATNFCLQRHGGLMARFEFRAGQLFQGRLPASEQPVAEVDLSGENETREERLRKSLETDRLEPLPLLSERPLWRSRRLRFGPNEVAWLWTHHHSLCDAASYPPLLVEIFRTYDELLAGDAASAAPASPDFLDHLAWLSAQNETAPKETWQRRLTRADAPTPLPEVRATPSSGEIEPNARAHRLAVDVPAEIEQNCARAAPIPN